MIERGFAIVLAAALLLAATGAQNVFAKQVGDSPGAEEVRAKVSKLGVGEKARVEVRLRDETKLKGFVSRAGERSFAVTDEKTNAATEVAYADVAQIRKRGGGLSGTTKALIWGGVAASAAVVLFVVRGAFCDGMCV
jgi:hypothetical protein